MKKSKKSKKTVWLRAWDAAERERIYINRVLRDGRPNGDISDAFVALARTMWQRGHNAGMRDAKKKGGAS